MTPDPVPAWWETPELLALVVIFVVWACVQSI